MTCARQPYWMSQPCVISGKEPELMLIILTIIECAPLKCRSDQTSITSRTRMRLLQAFLVLAYGGSRACVGVRYGVGCNQSGIQAAAGRPGVSKLAHYLAWGGKLPGTEEPVPLPAVYLGAVRQCSRRLALAQLLQRVVIGWQRMAEDTGRLQRVPCTQRTCPHCQGGLEEVQNALLECPFTCQ